jgi:diguanylate cyclase (GGDEF)-like protein
MLLVAAARAGFSGSIRDWRAALRLIAYLPLFLAVVYAFGWNSRPAGYHATHALILCFVYFYNFVSLRGEGIARGVFRFSLLLLTAAFLEHAAVAVYMYRTGIAPDVHDFYVDFGLHAVLAFAGMAMWIESQHFRVERIVAEMDRLRREKEEIVDLDRLTGLLNQAALAHRVEGPADFAGVVTVCDMDNFKEINDRFGHLAGDEILRNIGHLLRSSIRIEDEAFRWGGDEFVILFRNQHADVARKRMAEIETRLHDFRLRGHGLLPISFSWGIAETEGRSLRETLDEADRNMYSLKRSRA